MTPSERMEAALAPYLEAHAVTGPFAVGETRYDIRMPTNGARPWMGTVRKSTGEYMGVTETVPMFPDERQAKIALIAVRAVWLAIQAEELDALRWEVYEG